MTVDRIGADRTMGVFQNLLEILSGDSSDAGHPGDHHLDSPLDRPLLHLTDSDAWTSRDAVGGAFILGGPGSGKSSGPGRHLAMSFLESGFGGLCLCAKPSEASKWLNFARDAGRLDDVILFNPEHPELRFNPFDYELRRAGRGGGYTQNVTALFQYLLEISEGGQQSSGKDPFWERAVIELLTYTTDVLRASGHPVSLMSINDMIQSTPKRDDDDKDNDEFYDDEWRDSSFCFQCLAEAAVSDCDDRMKKDIEMAASYLVEDFPRLSERTRTSLLASFRGMALPFMRSPMREIFGTDTTLRIEDTFDRGKILIIDYPLREFAEVGRIVNALMKYFFMTAVERRQIDDDTPPCFLFADEAQEFITSYDSRFMATARESRCCTCFISQNYSGMLAAVKAQNARYVVDSLLANFMTKIFCANADSLTNKWAADLIAQSWQLKSGTSTSSGQNASMGSSTSQQLAYSVLPATFNSLTMGGPPEWIVETILFQGGRQFVASGTPYGRVAFPQHTDT